MSPTPLQSPLFSKLDDAERAALLALLPSRRYRAGECVFRTRDPAQCMYIVKSGHLHVVLDAFDGKRLIVAEIGSGEMLGELSFFDHQPRLSSAVVIEDAELLECSYPVLLEFLKQHPHAAWDMLSVMGQRLRKMDELVQRRAAFGEQLDEEGEVPTLGERVADRIVAFGGSWTFLVIFAVTMTIWILGNTALLWRNPFDPYPFILLNLVLSMVAAIQAPIFLMSQIRQSSVDRRRAELNYKVSLKMELELAELHRNVAAIDRLLEDRAIAAPATSSLAAE